MSRITKCYTDPLRSIVKRTMEGNNTDTLELICGHSVVKRHRFKWPRRTKCPECRIWNEEPPK